MIVLLWKPVYIIVIWYCVLYAFKFVVVANLAHTWRTVLHTEKKSEHWARQLRLRSPPWCSNIHTYTIYECMIQCFREHWVNVCYRAMTARYTKILCRHTQNISIARKMASGFRAERSISFAYFIYSKISTTANIYKIENLFYLKPNLNPIAASEEFIAIICKQNTCICIHK